MAIFNSYVKLPEGNTSIWLRQFPAMWWHQISPSPSPRLTSLPQCHDERTPPSYAQCLRLPSESPWGEAAKVSLVWECGSTMINYDKLMINSCKVGGSTPTKIKLHRSFGHFPATPRHLTMGASAFCRAAWAASAPSPKKSWKLLMRLVGIWLFDSWLIIGWSYFIGISQWYLIL